MVELKTKKNKASVEAFLADVEHDTRRDDSLKVLDLMREITGDPGTMWGTSIVGFGTTTYSNTTSKDNPWFLTGFSPRKQNLTLYIMNGFDEYDELLFRLGKHKLGKSCLYINKLEDVDQEVLKELVEKSVEYMKPIKE